tara:strand:- start:1447 stop:1929 length:483 start_codon:yes stop_codon:yes gene_type:complete
MQMLSDWIGMHKAYVMWFHAAHHLTKGTGFAGDHVNLYGKIYSETDEIFDHVVERVLGITNDENVACPSHVALSAVSKLKSYGSPANKPALTIASLALELNKNYIAYLENLVHNCKANQIMTIGTEDFVAGICNTLENYQYLLQQRVKETVNVEILAPVE